MPSGAAADGVAVTNPVAKASIVPASQWSNLTLRITLQLHSRSSPGCIECDAVC
jgi:hypothetical protein